MSRSRCNLTMFRLARARAAELGTSVAGYVRRLVACDLGAGRAAAEPHELFDVGESPGSDIARPKDAYVGEAVESVNWPQNG